MKYVPSALGVGQLSGKGGSVVASHNRYGSYLRNRVVPTNPKTARQTFVRDFFATLSQRWRTLTEDQRLGWINLAPQVPTTDRQGQAIILAGNALYIKTNILRDSVGDALIDAAPDLDSPPGISALTVAPAVGTADINVTYTAVGGTANNNFIVFASAPRSPGKTYISDGELKRIGSFAGNAASPVDITGDYELTFGNAWQGMAGMEIAIELFPVSENGLPGAGVRAQAVITP